MKVIKVSGLALNQCAVQFPTPIAFDDEQEPVKVLDTPPIQIMLKTGYDMIVANELANVKAKEEGAVKGTTPAFSRIKLVEGKVYNVEAESAEGQLYNSVLHESQLPEELLAEFLEEELFDKDLKKELSNKKVKK